MDLQAFASGIAGIFNVTYSFRVYYANCPHHRFFYYRHCSCLDSCFSLHLQEKIKSFLRYLIYNVLFQQTNHILRLFHKGHFNDLTTEAVAGFHLASQSSTTRDSSKKEILSRGVHLLQQLSFTLTSLGKLGKNLRRESGNAFTTRTTTTAGA